MVTSEASGAGGIRLRTTTWSPERVRARVVLVHGLGEHSGRYRHVAESLAARGFAVLAYDQRGHGHSQGRRGDVRDFSLFVEDFGRVRESAAAALPGEGPPLLFGQSMGALVLLRFLQTRSVEVPGAVLSAPWLRTAVPIAPWKELLAALLRRVAPGLPVRTGIDAEALTSIASVQRAYLQDPMVVRGLSVRLYDGALAAQEEAVAYRDPLPGRVLVLVPMEDRVTDPVATLSWAEGVGGDLEVVRLEGARHEPHNDVAREAVLERLGAWMEDRTRERWGG